MSEELISSYIDLNAVTKQTDAFLAQLDRIKKGYDDINNTELIVKSAVDTKASVSGIEALTNVSKRATSSMTELERATRALNKAQSDEALMVAKLKLQRDELVKATKEQAKESLGVATGTKTEQKAVADLSNDYKQLSLALKDAESRYAALYLQGKGGTQAAKDALATAQGYRAQLNEVDQALGNYQRNVGNYSSAFTGYAMTLRGLRGPTKLLGEALGIGAMEADQFRLIIEHAFQGIAAFFRGKEAKAGAEVKDTIATATNTTAQAANTTVTEAGAVAQTEFAAATTTASGAMTVFRGVLIASGIGIVIGLIALAVVRIIEFKKGLAEARAAQDDLNEAVKSDSYKTAIENFEKLKINVGLAKDGFLDKKEVLKQYNDTLGVTTGKVTSLDEAESALVNKGKAYIQMMLLQAAANIALEKAAQKAVAAEEERQKNRQEFAKTFADARVATPGAFNAQEYDADTKRIAAAQEKRKQDAIKKEQDAAKKQIDIAESFQKQAAEIAKENKFDFFGGKEDEKVKNTKTIADAVAELRKELAGIDLKQGLGELAPKDADIERVKAYDKAFEDIGKRGGSLNTPIIKDLKLELSPIEQRVIEQQIKDLIAKLPRITDVLNPPKEELQKVYDTYKSYAEGEAKFYEEIAQRELVVSQTKEANEKAILAKSYADRKISKEEYENGILNITDKYGRQGLAIQAKWLAEEIKLLPAGTKAREDAEKKLAELQILLNQRVLTDDQKTAQQRARILEGYFQKAKDVAGQVMDIIGGFINNSVTSQKNANQELDNERQITYENDVARINASSDTEEVKANKIKLLDAQRQAQKEKLERDQRQLDLQRAKFEEAQAITNIILGTTVAVLHQLGTGDPFTAFARAIAVGVIGAAQLAVAISAPLPKFKHGKFNNYEGAAIVGDGGKHEPIVREDGTIEMSPDTPTLAWIGSKDLVFPDVEALRNRVAMSQTDRVLSNGVLLQNNFIDLKPLERKMDGVIQAYMSRPVQQTVWTEKGVVTRVQNGFSQTEYINKYVRGL